VVSSWFLFFNYHNDAAPANLKLVLVLCHNGIMCIYVVAYFTFSHYLCYYHPMLIVFFGLCRDLSSGYLSPLFHFAI